MESKSGDYAVMVTIICYAYNHEKYIAQCLDGFVNQKTDFKYEAIVHDDASTDDTAAVIREYAEKYPEIIKPILQTENQYSKKNGEIFRATQARTRGKYVAICEGDDWWTDLDKLQLQVDYMEAHPECPMCFTTQGTFIQDSQKYVMSESDKIITYGVYEMLKANWVGTLTSLTRADLMKEYKSEVAPNIPYFPLGDWPMWLYLSMKGLIVRLPQCTGMYRVLSNSASHTKDTLKQLKFVVETYRMREYFNKLLGVNKPHMRFRTYRDAIKSSRKFARHRKEPFLPLVFSTLKYVIMNPAPSPSKELRAKVAELLKK